MVRSLKKQEGMEPKRRAPFLLVLALFGTVLYALFVSMNSITIHESLSHCVTYRIGGSASTADVAMADYEGGTSKHSSVPVPWEYTRKVQIGNTLYVSAESAGHGTIWVEIWVDGRLVKAKTSEGKRAIAIAAARL